MCSALGHLFDISYKLAGVSEQILKSLTLLYGFLCVQAMLKRVFVVFRRPRSRRPAMHPAAFFSVDRWRLASSAFAGSSAAALTSQHRCNIARIFRFCHFRDFRLTRIGWLEVSVNNSIGCSVGGASAHGFAGALSGVAKRGF